MTGYYGYINPYRWIIMWLSCCKPYFLNHPQVITIFMDAIDL